MIRALIVDDEPLARRGIRQLLEPCEDVDIVGECRNGREALTALETLDIWRRCRETTMAAYLGVLPERRR